MKTSLKLILIAGIGLGGLGEAASSASALPLRGLDPAHAPAADAAKGVENIRWICALMAAAVGFPAGGDTGSGGPATATAIGVQGVTGVLTDIMAGTLLWPSILLVKRGLAGDARLAQVFRAILFLPGMSPARRN